MNVANSSESIGETRGIRGWWPVGALLALVSYTLAAGLSSSRVFFFRDLIEYFYPMPELAWQMIRRGELPLWNPYSGFGAPLAAMADVLLYYPGTWLRFLLPRFFGFNFEIIAHFYLAALATYALARKLGMERPGAFTAAAAFALSGPMLSLGSMVNVLVAAAWVPVVLLAVLWAVERPTAWRIVVLGAALGMQAIGGEPLVSAATAGIGLGLCRRGWRRFFRVLVPAALFGMALIAVQLLPGLELLRKSVRSHFDIMESGAWSLHPLNLVETVFPDAILRGSWALIILIYGSGRTIPYLVSLYLGVMTLALAALALLRSQRKEVRWTAICAGLLLLFSLGVHTAFFTVFYELVPMVRQSRYPSKMMVPFAFCLALLAGWGLDALRERGRVQLWWVKWLLAACAGLVLGVLLAEPGTPAWAAREMMKMMGGLFGLVQAIRIAGSLILFAIVLRLARSHPTAAATLAALVLALDLAQTGTSVNPAAPAALFATPSPLVNVVGGGSNEFRVYGDAPMSSGQLPASGNWAKPALAALEARMIFRFGAPLEGVREARDLSPNLLYTPEYRQVALEAIASIDRHETFRLGALNVRYFIVDASEPVPAGVRPTTIVSMLNRKIAVWEIEGWRPRAELTGGTARVVAETPTHVTVRAESAAGGYLVLRDSYDDGWRAWVDGRSASIERTESIFRLVRVPAGGHTVDFFYRPWTFPAGLAVSGAALLVFLALGAASMRNPRSSAPSAENHALPAVAEV